MKEFIYKEEALMKLSEFSLKLEASVIVMLNIAYIISFLSSNLSPLPLFSLSKFLFSFNFPAVLSLSSQNLYSEQLGSDKVEIIKDSNEVDTSKLDGGKAYIQVTYVEPYFEDWELKNRLTVFDKSFNISKTIINSSNIFPFSTMDYSPWSSKNLIDRNRLKKFMQVGIDVKCMHTNFGERGLFGFRDKISLWSIKLENFNRSESAQKIHATRSRCHVHAHQF